MLLLHQIGSVKIGEVVRYTVTYTPAHDRILPAPEHLYLRIRNTSSSALRAAFVHGPYTLYVDAYPAHFNPNEKFENPRSYGVPEFEPMLKAGGSWSCRLVVPESIRHDAGSGGSSDGSGKGNGSGNGPPSPPSASWTINVCSQVIFSTSAAVNYEILLARDPKSLDIGGGITSGMPVILGGSGSSGSSGGTGPEGQVLQPGKVSDYQRGRDGHHPDQPKGVYSRAIRMQLEDTAALWNKPRLPGWDGPAGLRVAHSASTDIAVPVETMPMVPNAPNALDALKAPNANGASGVGKLQQTQSQLPALEKAKKVKKIHLVVLTHGLHSNLGGDMLFLKESIDEAVKQAKIDRKARRARERAAAAAAEGPGGSGNKEASGDDEEDDDDEEVVVRGYSGNATRTERGIKYLGKRLARYVLSMTYPDQPYFPYKASAEPSSPTVLRRRANPASHGSRPRSSTDGASEGHSSRKSSSSTQRLSTEIHRGYKFTQISFISHSLGGLVQTYAVAYIQKHSPQFFDLIKPINFIALASPFLGLNHENPLYVKFALDFGLVGRTGQDLGLTWRPPTLARSGWGALVGNLGDSVQRKLADPPEPESKPLLRILPTGPAHTALKKFRNRTVYSNVVNDGIVPLRTSCLLFLDWQGLGRVEKARREAGLVESVVGFGWAELTGANVNSSRKEGWDLESSESGAATATAAEATVAAAAVDDETKTTSGSSDKTGETSDSATTHEVPLPPSNATLEDDRQSLRATAAASGFHDDGGAVQDGGGPMSAPDGAGWLSTATTNNNPFSNFLNFLRGGESASPLPSPPRSTTPSAAAEPRAQQQQTQAEMAQPLVQPPAVHQGTPHSHSSKQNKIYQRSQTLRGDAWVSPTPSTLSTTSMASMTMSGQPAPAAKSRVTTGHELKETGLEDGVNNLLVAPPKTSFFESATDLLNPKVPTVDYLIDPVKRPRTIFHDRVYHPSDIPAPPLKSRPSGSLVAKRRISFQRRTPTGSQPSGSTPSLSGSSGITRQDSILSSQDYDDMMSNPDRTADEVIDSSSMKVEEKIARAYHRGMSWRKVLVKLEPDAHNNMLVRRTFANAFGWPVIKHLVDAHFSDAEAARTPDNNEDNTERALPPDQSPDAHGNETRGQRAEEQKSEVEDTAEGDKDGDGDGDGETTPKAAADTTPTVIKDKAAAAEAKDIGDSWSDQGWEESEESEAEEDLTMVEQGKVG